MFNNLKQLNIPKIGETLLLLGLLFLSIGTRIQYFAQSSYIRDLFVYQLGTFLYLSDIILLSGVLFVFFRSTSFSFRHVWPFLLLFLIFLIALLHVKQFGHHQIYQTFKYLEFGIICAAVYKLAKGDRWRSRAFFVLYLGTIFQALIAVWQFHVQHAVGLGWLGEYIARLGTPGLATIDTAAGKFIRAYGTLPHPNILGAILVVGLAVGYFYVPRATRTQRLLLIVANVVLLLGIFVSFSRTAWLAALILSLVYLIKYFRQRIQFNALIITGVVSCATILIFWNSFILVRTQNVSSSAAAIDRGTYNRYALEIIKTQPLLGTGIGNYIPTLVGMIHMQPWRYQPPHNIFLYLGAELGLPILLFFIWWLIRTYNRLLAAENSDLKFFYLTMLGVILLMSLFDHYFVTIQQGQLLFVVILGLIASLAYPHAQPEKSH